MRKEGLNGIGTLDQENRQAQLADTVVLQILYER